MPEGEINKIWTNDCGKYCTESENCLFKCCVHLKRRKFCYFLYLYRSAYLTPSDVAPLGKYYKVLRSLEETDTASLDVRFR